MRILVAGAAGFIAQHLCRRLLSEGHEVVGVDNYASGSEDNVAELEALPNFSFIEHDISTPLPKLPVCERIYNLACPASPLDFRGLSLEIMAVCADGTRNLLEYCRKHNARILHASTSEVYGDPKEHPQPETYWGNVNPIGPRSCYDEGKRFAEALIQSYRARHGVAARVVRIFNTYGPYMRLNDGRALPNFIAQAFANEPLTVHGDGAQTRSFCYATDLVDGLIRLCESDVEEPVNIGNPVEITIREFAEDVIRIAGSQSKINFVPRPGDDPQLRRPDITRATTLLDWKPEVDREEGLRQTIAWFRTRHFS